MMQIKASLVFLVGIVTFGYAQQDKGEPPFYADKSNLMVYINSSGHEKSVQTAADWHKRREHILANMQLVMGPLPEASRKVPLEIQEVTSETLPKVTRKKIFYSSEQGYRVPAYLLIPNGLKERVPAMLCLHGTDGSKGRTAGLGSDYSRYALELAERGYVTIAPDYITLGENKEINPYSMLGYVSSTMKGIWDHMCAVDVLQSLPEVDGERIGVIGQSLGGHNSLYVAAFDQRIKVIVTSVGFDSFYDYLGGKPGALQGWASFHYMPLIKTRYGLDPAELPFDFPEVLGLMAPRPLFIHAPLSDHNFQVASVKKCVASANPVYDLLGGAGRMIAIYPEGGHAFPREVREIAYMFLDNNLGVAPPQ